MTQNCTFETPSFWLSDIHLRTPGCQAYYLLDVLRTHRADTLYLAGDILDGWQLRKGWYWPQVHGSDPARARSDASGRSGRQAQDRTGQFKLSRVERLLRGFP